MEPWFRFRGLCLQCVVFFLAFSATAENVQLVKDINRQGANFSSDPSDLQAVGPDLFAILDDAVHGRELWKSNGTAAGTMLVKDLVPGGASALRVRSFVSSNGALFFLAWGPDTVDLWKSRGTEASTVLLSKFSRSDLRYGEVTELRPFRGGVVFSVDSRTLGREPWISDGTAEGTRLLKDIVPGPDGSYPDSYIQFRGRLIFAANAPASGRELWESDGTTAGTWLLQDIVPGPGSSSPSRLRSFNNSLYFSAQDAAHGREFWRTDGTPQGARLVADLRTGAASSNPEAYGGFQQSLILTTGRSARVYLMNRAEEFTLLTANSTVPLFRGFVSTPSRLYFRAYRGGGSNSVELWQSDGSPAGTFATPAPGNAPFQGIGPMAPVGNKLAFVSSKGTWVTDGTPKGAVQIPASNASDFEPLGSITFFVANHPTAGRELHVTDGTAGGTRMVKDVARGNSSSNPSQLYDVNGALYFTASVGNTRFAFISDGTPAGTHLLLSASVSQLIPLKNKLLLQMKDGLYASNPDGSNLRLLRSGLELGPIWTTVGSRLVFAQFRGLHGDHPIWSTDGTPEGTILLNPSLRIPDYPYPTPIPFVNLGSVAMIQCYDGSSYALYATDGTVAGTRKIVSFGNSYPIFFDTAEYRNEVYFSDREQLWKTNGRSATKVFTFSDYVTSLESVGDSLAVATYGNATKIWWSRDGSSFTSFNTVHQRLYRMVAIGDRLLFSAGNEIWSTRGSLETTTKIADAGMLRFLQQGAVLYFAGTNKEIGTELWVTDGTLSGTRLVKDLYPGFYSSEPMHFSPFGELVFFSANNGRIGHELWRLTR